MSKATWAYRLPAPHPARPPVHPFQPQTQPTRRHTPRGWYASQMDNYEHLKGGLIVRKSPQSYASQRERYLSNMRVEVAAGRPLWALDAIQDMYLNEVPPTCEHFREVLLGAARWAEASTFVECWRLMERQGVVPDDKTLCAAFEAAGRLGERDLLLQVWNRYCTEFAFLEDGELDPKPVRRQPFSLTRDDYYNLPWWKKQFDYDCNRDLGDAHRFNRTREIYASAAAALIAVGDQLLAEDLLKLLCKKLRDTPTPVAEPMIDQKAAVPDKGNAAEQHSTGLDKKQTRYRIPNVYLFSLRRNTRGIDWVPNHEWLMMDHQVGPDVPERSRDVEHGDPRFYTNAQFVLYVYEKAIAALPPSDAFDRVVELEKRAEEELPEDGPAGAERSRLNWEDLITTVLQKAAACGVKSAALPGLMHTRCERHRVRPTCAMYQAVLAAHAAECPPHDAGEQDVAGWSPQRAEEVTAGIDATIQELHRQGYQLDLETCTAALDALVRARTKRGHEYFVRHILRSFAWNNDQVAVLLREYRLVGEEDAGRQAKLCRRAHLWCQRYNVGMSEENKQYIEDDHDRIGVQVRTKDELLLWKFRNQHQLQEELKPYLPNPVTDRITHTLRHGDHQDPDHAEKWVVPYSNAGRSFNWAYADRPHAPPQASDVRDLTDIERVKRLPQQTLLSAWAQPRDWASKHGAPYRPELNHEKLHINRWLEEPNKAFPGN